ncbi:MAG: hypothetical protein VB858_08460 [Planctomycetaceae bacterium]
MRRLQKQVNHPSRHRRSGLSLLEVILSLTIFVGAVSALSQLSTNGTTAAVTARLETQAILRCESKLAEVATAIEPLDDVLEEPFSDEEDWTWSLESQAGPHADVLLVTVSVAFNGESALSSVNYSLSRLIRDPAIFEDTVEEDAP